MTHNTLSAPEVAWFEAVWAQMLMDLGIDMQNTPWYNGNMTETPALIEASVEWNVECDDETDYVEVARTIMVEAGWIAPDAHIELAGWDSLLVQLNEATQARLADEQYIEAGNDILSIGIELEF